MSHRFSFTVNGDRNGSTGGELLKYSLQKEPFIIDGRNATVEDILSVGNGRPAQLSTSLKFLSRIDDSRELLAAHLAKGTAIYGANTSYGDAVTADVKKEHAKLLNDAALYQSGCGIGKDFDAVTGRQILFARLLCISKGYSGVSLELLRQMELFLAKDIIPVIPEQGSVGASGDLVPMSYIAAALMGKRKVYYNGEIRQTEEVLKQLGITPHVFGPKEVLSIINSTNVMSAVACQAWKRAEYFSRMAARVTGLACMSLLGNKEHFHPNLFKVRLQKGPGLVANWIYSDMSAYGHMPQRIQDRYSIRCAPHVIGVLTDSLVWMKRDIEDEINSVNDNPIIDIEKKEIYFGGHFYGGYIAFSMDSLCAATTSVADLLERQISQLVDYKFNNGLPPNLSGAPEELLPVSLAFKNFQIVMSSLVAEAQKLCFPAAIFSRSTESHNQDKVSMGTIAARYALEVMDLVEKVVAGCLLAAVQGISLRIRDGHIKKENLNQELAAFYDDFRNEFEFVENDRDLDIDLKRCIGYIQERKWQPYQ